MRIDVVYALFIGLLVEQISINRIRKRTSAVGTRHLLHIEKKT